MLQTSRRPAAEWPRWQGTDVPRRAVVRNRLLAALAPDDYDYLEPMLEFVPLPLQAVLIEAHEPIDHIIFPETGLTSTLASSSDRSIEVGLIGREGLVGLPVVLGLHRAPHSVLVLSPGEGVQIRTRDFEAALLARPSIFRPLGLFAQSLLVQVAATAYANTRSNLEARLARWILMVQDRVGEHDILFTHELMSKMLGVRRPGVTDATHVLEGLGAIRTSRSRIEVRDRNKLIAIAGDAYRMARIDDGWGAGDP